MSLPKQLLTTVVLVIAGIWIYDSMRAPSHGGNDGGGLDQSALDVRIDGLEAQVRRIEDRLAGTLRPDDGKGAELPLPKKDASATGPHEDEDLNRLEAIIRELDRRKEIERLGVGVKSRITAMKLGLSEAELSAAVDILVGFEAERADFWRQVQQEALRDQDQIASRYAPIKQRYEKRLRGAFSEKKARALIEAFLK